MSGALPKTVNGGVNEVSKKICLKCGSTGFRRVNRVGLLQNYVLPYFGYYPWECVMCRRKRYFRDNGHRSGARSPA